MVDTIFLDAGYTLVYPKGISWLLPVNLYDYINQEYFEVISSTDEYKRSYSTAYKFLDDNHNLPTEHDEYEVFVKFYEILFSPFRELDFTASDYENLAKDMVFDYDKFSLYSDVIPSLDAWQKEGFTLAVISDTFPSLKNVLNRLNILGYFKHLTFSCNLGVFKPHRQMYENALQNTGAINKRSVFIDDIIDNLDGASKFGIMPIQICRSNNTISAELNKGKNQKHPKYNSLTEIRDIL